jgi:hypothetical protein
MEHEKESDFQSITVGNLFKLARFLFPRIQSDLVQSDLLGFKGDDGTYHYYKTPIKKLEQFSDMTSDHIRIYFMKHKIHPHYEYPEFFSRERALIAMTYQWILTFSEMEDYFSEESIDNFNIVHAGKCERIPLNKESVTVWIDIFFNYQCAKDFGKVLDYSQAQYQECTIHCALGTKDLFTRGFCLLELAIRNGACKTTGLLESCRRETNEKLDARIQEHEVRQYFDEMAVTKSSDEETIKKRIIQMCESKDHFNWLVHSMRRHMTSLMAGSISIQNLSKLTERMIKDAREMNFEDLGDNPRSIEFLKFFREKKLNPRLKYPELFNSEPPMIALSSLGTLPLSSIAAYFSSHNLALFNETYGSMCGTLPSQGEATVWIDIFFNNYDQDDGHAVDAQTLLRTSDRRICSAKFHCVLYDEGIWERGWILHELVVRKTAGGRTGFLPFPEGRASDSGAEAPAPGRDYYSDMKCDNDEHKRLIQQGALAAFESAEKFNDHIASVRRGIPSCVRTGGRAVCIGAA